MRILVSGVLLVATVRKKQTFTVWTHLRAVVSQHIYQTLKYYLGLISWFQIISFSQHCCSKRSSVIIFLMEIIQLIAVNADHELQHIVDKGCQSCALIPQQMEYFRNFVLGFEADIYGSLSIGTLYGTEKRLLEIGQQNLFSLES